MHSTYNIPADTMRGRPSIPISVIWLCAILMHLADVTSSQGDGESASNAAREWHNAISEIFKGHPNITHILPVLCADVGGRATQCAGVPDYRNYYRGKGTTTSARSKRHSNGYWRPFTFPSFPRFPSSSPVTGNGVTVFCPQQLDQASIYRLSSSSEGYPAVDLAEELSTDPRLPTLVDEIVLPTDPPELTSENFVQTSPYACPFSQLRLWQYYSPSAASTCWVMQTFQENILYKVCSTRFCNCNTASSTGSNFWPLDPLTRNMCLTEHRQVSLWAFCPSIPSPRIRRDRIIVPVGCYCQNVRCSRF